MVKEVLAALNVRAGGRYVDCTLGEAGHSLAILEAASPAPNVLGIDLDSETIERARQRLANYADSVTLVHGNYADIAAIAADNGFLPINGVLLDLGLSSLQLGSADRGFSFQREARLDMRFDPDQTRTAHDVVNGYSEQELANVIYELGEERASRRIARAIVHNRPVDTTTRLADIVASVLGRRPGSKTHPATRTFQAIRMEVNSELENVRTGITEAISVLAEGGRLAVITYHSIEDRVVKNLLRREATACICPPETPVCTCGHTPTIRLVSRRVIKPAREEVASNPRSRSAKLRVAEKT
jgi:16S rRNA (cytosine1402-N4)-methyltransferase